MRKATHVRLVRRGQAVRDGPGNGSRRSETIGLTTDMRGHKLCETCGLYFPRPQNLQERDIDRAVFYCSTLRGVGFSSERPFATMFISKNHRAVSMRVPSGESFAATTNLRRENQ